MSTRVRRLVLTLPVILAVGACAGGASPSPSAAPTPAPSVSATAAPSVPPAEASASPAAASSAVTQTDTAWGRIWDALPPGFPRYPGAAPADDASAAPSSGRYAVSGSDPETIATWLQAAMETALFSTDVSGPLEDGTFTLDSVGVAGCRIQTMVAPLGGMTFVTVLYAADCPIG